MKTSLISSFFLVLMLAVASCKKEFPDDQMAISDLSVSECKTNDGSIKTVFVEYLTLKTVDDYYLQFSHFNSVFNCQPGQITLSIGIVADTITVDENETEGLANCICPYDIGFRLGPLKYGNYTIIFQKGGLTFKEYTLDYGKKTNIRIDL